MAVVFGQIGVNLLLVVEDWELSRNVVVLEIDVIYLGKVAQR